LHRHRNEVTGTRADPAPGEAPGGGTNNQPRNLARRITGLFRQTVKALTLRLAAPAPPKKRQRSGGDEARAADLRKQIKRLFRKVRRHVSEDWRDAPPTVDSDWWHWHCQSMADVVHEHHRGLQQRGPDYPSPTP
jgi:hypothetical protein